MLLFSWISCYTNVWLTLNLSAPKAYQYCCIILFYLHCASSTLFVLTLYVMCHFTVLWCCFVFHFNMNQRGRRRFLVVPLHTTKFLISCCLWLQYASMNLYSGSSGECRVTRQSLYIFAFSSVNTHPQTPPHTPRTGSAEKWCVYFWEERSRCVASAERRSLVIVQRKKNALLAFSASTLSIFFHVFTV